MTQLQAGDMAPDFKSTTQDGETLTLADLKGQRTILYFYPKDNTPGCTAQACDLRDNYGALTDAGYQVIGVSVDPPESHRKFAARHSLPFPLVADTDHRLVELTGVWGEKKLAGRTYMGTRRTTFIIGTDGIVERVITPREVKTKTHASQILAGE